jgi:hypothetical protein
VSCLKGWPGNVSTDWQLDRCCAQDNVCRTCRLISLEIGKALLPRSSVSVPDDYRNGYGDVQTWHKIQRADLELSQSCRAVGRRLGAPPCHRRRRCTPRTGPGTFPRDSTAFIMTGRRPRIRQWQNLHPPALVYPPRRLPHHRPPADRHQR